MNLKRDTLIAVSFAGLALAMTVVSSKLGQTEVAPRIAREGEAPLFSRELLDAYRNALDAIEMHEQYPYSPSLVKARKLAKELQQSGRLAGPLDYRRASILLATSPDPSERQLAQRLAREALSEGIQSAKTQSPSLLVEAPLTPDAFRDRRSSELETALAPTRSGRREDQRRSSQSTSESDR
jgi:hypothetical protein